MIDPESKNALEIHHIGIAVESAEASAQAHQKNFGGAVIERETLTERGLNIVFVSTKSTWLEFISPTEAGKNDPSNSIAKFLSNRGPGLHHICYEVSDIAAKLAQLQADGVKLIDIVARPGAMHTIIAFLYPSPTDGTLIELCQKV